MCGFFFFQAEDGIRDIGVTGVQTCALPISGGRWFEPTRRYSTPAVRSRAYARRMTERCWRCPVEMEWRHGTWQCPRCRFKLGCCEGEPQTACEPVVRVAPWQPSSKRTT